MSSANLDLVRSIYGEWAGGDWDSTWWADPEIELILHDGVTQGTYSGLAGIADAWRDFLGAWKDFKVVVDEYIDVGDDRVLALVHNQGQGRISGVDVESTGGKSANLFTIRDGKVVRLKAYWHRQTALDELGLSERDD
ncbi:MAG: SnoaL-like domain [Solirubrobacterales bacterium]|nr:SnoaL-like domain [Solirubrobacterales bacterium]